LEKSLYNRNKKGGKKSFPPVKIKRCYENAGRTQEVVRRNRQ
jgi:hypothetical protein